MKLTESKLKQIIKEEIEAVLEELKDKEPDELVEADPEVGVPARYNGTRGWTIEVERPDGSFQRSLQCITMTLARKRALQIRSKGYKVRTYYGCKNPI